jgi:hypothetical protein
MTAIHAAGRHRKTPGARPPLSLLLEYPGAPDLEPVFLGMAPPDITGPRLARSRYARAVIVSAAVAGIAASVAFGSFLLLRSPGAVADPGGSAPVVWFPSLPPFSTPAARPAGRPSARPAGSRAARRHRAGETTPSPARAPASASGAADHAIQPASPTLPVVVRFLDYDSGPDAVQGQFDIVNNGTRPITNWEIALLLPDDALVSVSNASQTAGDGVLILEPLNAAEVVPADGGTLDVRFTARGTETVPQACAFDETACA